MSNQYPAGLRGIDSNQYVFVFGSKLSGRHDRGDAKFAVTHHGAIQGRQEGRQGNAYAIPVASSSHTPLGATEIGAAIYRFSEYAYGHPEIVFQITRLGCGHGGYPDEAILGLFIQAEPLPSNCLLPGVWLQMTHPHIMRLLLMGDSLDLAGDRLGIRVDQALDRLSESALRENKRIELVTAGTRRCAERAAREWASRHRLPSTSSQGVLELLGRGGQRKISQFERNVLLTWYSSDGLVMDEAGATRFARTTRPTNRRAKTGALAKMARNSNLLCTAIQIGDAGANPHRVPTHALAGAC